MDDKDMPISSPNGNGKLSIITPSVVNTRKIDNLTEEKKNQIRNDLFNTATKYLGVKYEFGAEWTDYSKPPETIDCSELTQGIFKINKLEMPDGSQNQFNYTVQVDIPRIGDLAFFGRNKDITKIYHVGILLNGYVLEARAFDKDASFETGKVINRPVQKWTNYKNFCGFRSHPLLV